MGSFSIWHWLIVLVIVMLIFGTKKLRNVGQDLGGRRIIKKNSMKDATGGEKPADAAQPTQQVGGQTIDVEVKEKTKS